VRYAGQCLCRGVLFLDMHLARASPETRHLPAHRPTPMLADRPARRGKEALRNCMSPAGDAQGQLAPLHAEGA
jgi:hypothetical protein